jgi:hypothetical protein
VSKRSGPVGDADDSDAFGAVGAAEDIAFVLHAVPDDHAAAVNAPRSQGVNGALEAIEGVRLSVHFDRESLVVFVSANVAASHDWLLDLKGIQ